MASDNVTSKVRAHCRYSFMDYKSLKSTINPELNIWSKPDQER